MAEPYQQRFRGGVSTYGPRFVEARPEGQSLIMDPFSTKSAQKVETEKRQYPRFRVRLEVELNVDGQGAPLRTHTSDVSLGGGYVEMMFTLAVGTRLDLTLWLAKERWRSRAEVTTCDPQFGNGFRFLMLDEEKRSRLKQFLDTLPSQEPSDAPESRSV